MKPLALLLLLSCGAPTELDLSGVAPVHVAPAAVEVPVARCYCCWPVEIHGPGRCRFARAASAPADECESDPAQVCTEPDTGSPRPSP